MTDPRVELKACPCCCESARIGKVADDMQSAGGVFAECERCGLTTRLYWPDRSNGASAEARAAEAWNHRAPLPLGNVEQLVEAYAAAVAESARGMQCSKQDYDDDAEAIRSSRAALFAAISTLSTPALPGEAVAYRCRRCGLVKREPSARFCMNCRKISGDDAAVFEPVTAEQLLAWYGTEQEMHRAWRKRAEEAEAALSTPSAVRAQTLEEAAKVADATATAYYREHSSDYLRGFGEASAQIAADIRALATLQEGTQDV